MLPEVVLLAELKDALGGDADLLVPNLKGVVVGRGGLISGEDGGVEPLRVQAHPVGAGEELPRPVDGVPLEVVAEREIAQHLEIGAVAGGVADVLNVAGADALLAGTDAVAGGLLLAGEPGLHGGHAGVDEQQAGVVLGDEGETAKAQMALALKELEKQFPQLVETVVFGFHGYYLH